MTGQQRTRVVVLGGGYAGTYAANHLQLRDDVDVTLVNARPEFVERIRLHQLVAGTRDATVNYSDLLNDRVTLMVDTASRIDVRNRTVELASRRELAYDYLIYATGSVGAITPSVPGAAEFAHSVAELESAQLLRDRLDAASPETPIVVVGGGLTGIETASELGEQGRNVTLVCGGELGPSFSAGTRRSVAKWFRRHEVSVLSANVVEVRPNAVMLDDGTELPAAITIWTAGFGVSNLADSSGLSTDELGRLLTDETLTSVDDDRILAAGDSASPSGKPLRMSCQAAVPLGIQAANTVMSRIAGTAPDAIRPRFVGSCVSLGRTSGVFQIARQDDTSRELHLGGPLAARLKEYVCKTVTSSLTAEARKPGSAPWLKGEPREVQAEELARS
jgi:NADH dehydrogenase